MTSLGPERHAALPLLPPGEPMGIQDIRDALVIRENGVFLLTDASGEVPAGNQQGFGLYYADTRYLSTFQLSLLGRTPVVLLSTAALGFGMEQVVTNPTLEAPDGRPIQRGTIEVRRQRVISDVLEERLVVTNYNVFPVTVELLYQFDADFADIFAVRGRPSRSRGKVEEPRYGKGKIIYTYLGSDGFRRQTQITFTPEPARLMPHRALYRFHLGHRESASVRLLIHIVERGPEKAGPVPRLLSMYRSYQAWLHAGTEVFTNNEFFNRVLHRALSDLRMLQSRDLDGSGAFIAAGTPWFDTLFGRDSAIVGLQTLAFQPTIARDALAILARYQGARRDPWRDEEPGKIIHELRRGEMSNVGELPFGRYYGSVDATPLFLLLAGEYFSWTADRAFLADLKPALVRGLDWIERWGDLDGSGYVKYEKRSPLGLVNQGWKDSPDAIVHADGTPVRPPIALVEVQGYVYAAKLRLAAVFEALGDSALAARLRREASRLKLQFNRDFWLPEQGFYALALGGDGRPSEAITSNVGHALWAEIIFKERAPRVVERLIENDMFTGWGIRTLSSSAARYNPIGYHLGTVWPHDNSLIAMGFKKYGQEEALNEVATALFDAAVSFPYYRLPELFAGAPRAPLGEPVPYPVACRPQAWAAGSILLTTQAILGISANAPARELRIVQPRLPPWLDRVEVRNLRVGRDTAHLLFERRGPRTQMTVLRTTGDLTVRLLQRWPFA